MYRSVSTAIWTDDAMLEMSPEQKLLFLYLQTNPYASACGIYKMHLKTMSFQVGITGAPFESALRGLCSAFPDFVAADWTTNEIALLQYPKQTLITAGARVMAHVAKEVEKVESIYLLRELIARNSATIGKPYLEQLRRLQMSEINDRKHGEVYNSYDNQQDNRKREKEIEIEKEGGYAEDCSKAIKEATPPVFVIGDTTQEVMDKVVETLRQYFAQNPERRTEIPMSAMNKANREQFGLELMDWIRYNANNRIIMQSPVKHLTSGPGNFTSWLAKDWCRKKYEPKAAKPAYAKPEPQVPEYRKHVRQERKPLEL